METLIVIGLVALIVVAVYRSGKSTGSRKGYGVVQAHYLRRRRRR